MKNLQSLLILGTTIFVGIVLPSLVFAEENVAAFKGYLIRDIGKFVEIEEFKSDNNLIHSQSDDVCSPLNTKVSGFFGGPGMDTMVMDGGAEFQDIEPTATINWIFEIEDNPLNNIPELPPEENFSIRFGDDFKLKDDPDNDNLVIVSVPALSAADSHDIICQTFDISFGSRYLIHGLKSRHILVLLDVEFIRFPNVPVLLTREIVGRSYIRIEPN